MQHFKFKPIAALAPIVMGAPPVATAAAHTLGHNWT
jgi:hypothetical protein